jgi:hypothetical protein
MSDFSESIRKVSGNLWRASRMPIKVSGVTVACAALWAGAVFSIADAIDSRSGADDEIRDVESARYVPDFAEGAECLYIEPSIEKEIRYEGSSNGIVVSFVRWALPGIESGDVDVNTVAGTVPEYNTAPCALLNEGITNVFQTRVEAVKAELDNAASVAENLREAQDQYPRYQDVKFTEVSIP